MNQKDLSSTYLTSLHQYTEQHIDFQLKSVKEKLQSIYPLAIRKKRGLINGLGNIVKFVSGNLDQEDAQRYDAAIEKLQNNENQIVHSLNQQISLTHKILENNNKTFSLMIHNQNVIKESIEELNNNSTHFLSLLDTYTQIKFNLDTLLSILTNIENAISFAKLGTLHHSIISIDDIKSILDSLLKYHSKDQLVYSEIEDSYKQYDITPVDAYFSNTKLIFALHIPLVHPETFSHYHLYSIPTQNFTTIIPKNSFFTMSNDMFQYDSGPCRYLNPNYLCPNNYLIDGTQESDCIFSILQVKYNEAVCQTATIVVNKPLIEEVSESNYIAIFPQQEKVQTRCDETDFVMLKGSFLIEIPYQCSIETSGHTPTRREKPRENHYFFLKLQYTNRKSKKPNSKSTISHLTNYVKCNSKEIDFNP
ncbi:uncharacterized protein [Leptinotarsa decemlineata]|uniref:uncharacterized protein n=1 Tax=Leptinotarsa decemlineata TaxID=7539 RepID=UPI003D30BAE5